jgi:hypothetical protein
MREVIEYSGFVIIGGKGKFYQKIIIQCKEIFISYEICEKHHVTSFAERGESP